MSNKRNKYRTIPNIPGEVIINLPNGTKEAFKNSSEAQKFFDDNYGEGYSMEITSTKDRNGEITINGGELPEVTVTGLTTKNNQNSNTDGLHERKGVDRWIGANYSPRFNAAYAKLGINPLNWTKYIPESYWDTETHKAVKKYNTVAAGMVAAPFVAYTAAEILPWMFKNIAPYLSARGWLGATQATGTTPSWLTPTSATAIDASIDAGTTGISINDMILNGPTVGNVLGTIAGVAGLGFEVSPIILEGVLAGLKAYNTFKLGRELNKASKSFDITTNHIKVPLNVGWGPRLTIHVTHKSDHAFPLSLYNDQRWDVLNEGANPFGIWFQGKFGVPRYGPTIDKARKAYRARLLFSKRPYTHSGDLTLDKPLITIGDVPNRSILSYLAEQMGADGLIYNNIYDNGYNANLVLLSFKLPDNYMLTIRGYKGGPRKSSDYEFFTTDPKYASNFGTVKPYYILSKFPIVTNQPLMGSRDIVTMDQFVYDISKGKPVDAIIGHDQITGEFPYTSLGDEILIFNPNLATPSFIKK